MGRPDVSITTQDLNQLIREPSPKVRSHIAAKVSVSFNRSNFTGNENKLAIEILRLLLRDTASSVRRAIAENLKSNTHVPRDIVLALIADEADIAVPMLECSEILTDDDLTELVSSCQELRKWLAITRRPTISNRLSRSLLGTQHEEVVISLLGNPGARLEERDLDEILRDFRGIDNVLEALVCRGGLPILFAEKLYSIVSAQMKKQLTRRYRLPRGMIGPQIDIWRESAILRFLSSCMVDNDLLELAQAMHKGRRLNDMFVIRTLLAGEISFFETALSVRASIPLGNVKRLIGDRGGLGFRTLYLSAGLPDQWLDALSIIAQYWQKEQDDSQTQRQREACLLEYLRAKGYEKKVTQMSAIIKLIEQSPYEPRILH